MNRWIIVKQENRIISAYMQGNSLVQIQLDPTQGAGLLGNIYVGKVKNIVKNIRAAFIEIENGIMGYYSLEDNCRPIFTNGRRVRDESGRGEEVRIGDELLVQVSRDAVKTKAPVLTANFNLTGKYAVLVHGNSGCGISLKIAGEEKRRMLKDLTLEYSGEDYGFIMRTNAAGTDEETLREELAELKNLYLQIVRYGVCRKCFNAVYRTPPAYLCALRDSYGTLVDEFVTDDEGLYEEIRRYLSVCQKEDLDKLRLYKESMPSLISLYGIVPKLEEAQKEKVWLKSGGNIVIQPTEALTVIDVNTGKAVEGRKKVQETFRKVNLEAAREIARQLRLRNLSGIIIVDFIDMTDPAMRQELLDLLEQLFREDPVRTKLVDMTALNLVEITRKKVRKPLYEQVAETGGSRE